jgi:hypothetical protein
MSGGKILEQVKIELRNNNNEKQTMYIDVFDNSLAHKWLTSLNYLLENNFHLEKNYCFLGFTKSQRNGWYILEQVNKSIHAINQANIGYTIDDYFTMENTITNDPVGSRTVGRNIIHDRLNRLHRYFEDLQGVSGSMSLYFNQADSETRWHIRQLNLLCHEFETWALSYRKEIEAPEWQRPSQLMCWLNAPRFTLDENDYELFGVETINRALGGVFVGVNKAIGKHHWEVFNDEGRDSRIGELVTSSMRSQTEAAGDFDIEWANNPGNHVWQQVRLVEFKEWLVNNGFNPKDKTLTIGHPQIGQVDLIRSFGTEDYQIIWKHLNNNLNVYSVSTSDNCAIYDYHWSDPNFMNRQVIIINQRN